LVVGTATLSVEVMPVFDRFVIATKKLKLTLLFDPSETLHLPWTMKTRSSQNPYGPSRSESLRHLTAILSYRYKKF
jgi:hypothetical protein